MIYTGRTITVGGQESIIDKPILLYRGDRDVLIEFTLVGDDYSFADEGNVIKSTNASHGQLVLNTPSGENMFTDVTKCEEGKVKFLITYDMIDELDEVGFYSFQIRLFDEAQQSRVSIPPVMNGFELRRPIAAEDENNLVGIAYADYSIVQNEEEIEEIFNEFNQYIRTGWQIRDVITSGKLNKIEAALYGIHENAKRIENEAKARDDENKNELDSKIDSVDNRLDSKIDSTKSELQQKDRDLDSDISAINSTLQTKVNNSDLDVERKRIDMLTKIESGQTEGNAELLDIRIGHDGEEYDTAGSAIREQIGNLDDEIQNIKKFTFEDFIFENAFIDPKGKYSTNNGVGRYCTDFIRISNANTIEFFAETNNQYVSGLTFYDINKVFISSICSIEGVITEHTLTGDDIPENAKYIRASTLNTLLSKSYIRINSINSVISDVEAEMVNKLNDIQDAIANSVDTSISKINETIETIKKFTFEDFIFENAFIHADGTYTTNNGAGRYCTDFIRISNANTIEFFGETHNIYISALAFYDSDKEFIRGISAIESSPTKQIIQSSDIPTNAKYIRASTYSPILKDSYVRINSINSVITDMESELNVKINELVPRYVGVNKFNKRTVIKNHYLGGDDSLRPLDDYFVSDFIRVKENTTYAIYNIGYTGGGGCTIYYDNKKRMIASHQGNELNSTKIIQTPSNCSYIRLTGMGIDTTLDTAQIEEGDSFTVYHDYVDNEDLSPLRDDLSTTMELIKTKLDKKLGVNIFNKDSNNIIIGKYLNNVGTTGNNTDYYISDYMEVIAGEYYVHEKFNLGGAYLNIYDKNKIFISATKDNPVLIPENGFYIRMSGVLEHINEAQLELGRVYSGYKPYNEFGDEFVNVNANIEAIQNEIDKLNGSLNRIPKRLVLPNKLYVMKNKQNCIYYENILFKNLNHPMHAYFNKGVNYNRLVSLNFDTESKNQKLKVSVVDDMDVIESRDIEYDVVDGSSNFNKRVNMLFIGDSFTDMGNYIKETKDLLSKDGVSVNLIGTCGDGKSFNAEGLSGGTLLNTFMNSSAGVARVVDVTGVTQIPSTGYPGQTYRDSNGNQWIIRGGKIKADGTGKLVVTKFGAKDVDFDNFPSSGTLTKVTSGTGQSSIKYSNPVKAYHNPFINHSTGALDFKHYIDFWGFEIPNIVVIQFTWNDLSTWLSDDKIMTFVNNIKSSIDHIKNAYPNTKFIVSIEPFGSINGNKDWHGKKYTVLKLVNMLIDNIEKSETYNTFVKIAPSYAFVDLIYGYSSSTTVTCNRYPNVIEHSGGDGVHPSTGMLQIADCIYPIVHHLLESM